MKAALYVFGLTLTCLLHPAAGIPVQPGFNWRRVDGVWHRVAMVLQEREADVVGPHIRIVPLPKGDLSVQRKIEIRNTCRQVSSRYRHTNTPGQFHVFISYGSQSSVHFVATDYESYLVLHIQTSDDSGLYLFARGLNVSDATVGKFGQHAESLGFSKHSIVYPVANERCTFRTGYV